MVLTGENGIAGKQACLSATFFTTNPTWNNLGFNPCFRDEKSITMWLSQWHGLTTQGSVYRAWR